VAAIHAPDRPSYAARLVRPFAKVLRNHPKLPPDALDTIEAFDAEERIPAATLHTMLEAAVQLTGDADLGLRASRGLTAGDCGTVDYVVSTAATVRDAIEAMRRYMPLVNDASEVRLEVGEGRAALAFESRLELPRAASDFQIGAVFSNHVRHWWAGSLEVSFSHGAPKDTTEYARTFGNAAVTFCAPVTGFAFPREALELRLPHSDPKLHEVVRGHAERMLADLPKAHSLTEEVVNLVAKELEGGNPNAAHVASKLHMSVRTLTRRLEREGTTFKELVDNVRRKRALDYVGRHDVELADIAELVGFSQTGAFHRAFRRWTGKTPLQYRRARRG
jgi:AraC-like DNA-binding protein